jgi:mandelate racemase
MVHGDGAVSVRQLTARPVLVPLSPPLQSAAGQIDSAPLLLLDLVDSDGATGSAYVCCFHPALLAGAFAFAQQLADLLVGLPAAPRRLRESLPRRLRVLGRGGMVAMVLGGLDLAAWDGAARRAGLPLVTLLGGDPVPVPAYASLRSAQPAALADEAARARDAGFTSAKFKIGHGALATDLAVIRAGREAVGDQAEVMVDYNQTLTVAEAQRRVRVLDGEGLAWIEEPVATDDPHGSAVVAREARTPIQLGENWFSVPEVAAALAARAGDLAMLDVVHIGGVSGWLAASALTGAAGVPVSSHLYPEVSAHLLAATPGRHRLEFLDLAGPLLAHPARPVDGTLAAGTRPGSGVEWDEDAVNAHLAD